MHKDQLIGIGVLVKIVLHAVLRGSQHDLAIAVHQHRLAAGQEIRDRLDLKALEAAVFQHLLLRYARRYRIGIIYPGDLCRRVTVVQQ